MPAAPKPDPSRRLFPVLIVVAFAVVAAAGWYLVPWWRGLGAAGTPRVAPGGAPVAAATYVGEPGVHEVPRGADEGVARVGSLPGDGGADRRGPCSATSTTRRSPTRASTSTFFRRDGKFFVRTDGPDGALHDYEIKYTFGYRPLQQYLIEFPGGRMQCLPIAWDTRPKAQGGQRWFHLYPDERITHDRSAALDGAEPELELHVRRLPLDQPPAQLRPGDRTPTRRRGRRSTCRARPATARGRPTWRGPRTARSRA